MALDLLPPAMPVGYSEVVAMRCNLAGKVNHMRDVRVVDVR